MSMPFERPYSSNTLSVRFRPGEDLRTPPTSSQSVFTHGAFRIQRDLSNNALSADTSHLRFDGYESLTSLNMTGATGHDDTAFVHANELNLTDKEISSYVYFGSMRMEAVVAMNNIIDNWPFAILSSNSGFTGGTSGSGITIYNYTGLTGMQSGVGVTTSRFRTPFSSITNMGGVLLTSGSTRQGRSLLADTQDFVIQLSGSTTQYAIVSYSFSAGEYLEFTVAGHMLGDQPVSSSTLNYYIRPTSKIVDNFNRALTPLEYQILYRGTWLMPNPYFDDGSTVEVTYTWPKAVDGFNIDIYGDQFEQYRNDFVDFSTRMDDEKTDVLLRTVIPENYLELDSEQLIYRNIVQAYAHQFDELKRYIDGISYAHTVTYDGQNNVPNKFLFKLTELLGLKLPKGFNEFDLFEYLSGDSDGAGNSISTYNFQTWKRILINITWLFKKKGTRDALIFIFKLIGAPESLIRLNEFVYDIQRTISMSGTTGSFTGSTILSSQKINSDGFIQYDNSVFAFQEGGIGRGNGRRYIDQWRPEFDPVIRVDNIKTYTGDTVQFVTDSMMNTKELDCALDPAQAVEYDIFSFYQMSGTCWVWGSGDPFQFQNMNVPFEYALEDCGLVNPERITGMTFAEYIDFIYVSNVRIPRRKTENTNDTVFYYKELKSIYMNYYLMSEPLSNRLNMKKIEAFLHLIELNFFSYSEQFIPATSILRTQGTVYRNTMYNRQRFMYREGINAGSEFQTELPVSPPATGITITLTGVLEDIPSVVLDPLIISSVIETEISVSCVPLTVQVEVIQELVDEVNGFRVQMHVGPTDSQTEYREVIEERI